MSSSLQPILALVGDSVAGNPTQYMFEKAFACHELDWRYLSVEVSPAGLEDAVRGLRAMGFRGGNCAGAHKTTIGPLLDRLGRSAELSGVVNYFHREEQQLVGENTEGLAVLEALRQHGELAGKQAVLFGAGQVGRAVAIELAIAGVGQLWISNRHEEPAAKLVELLQGNFPLPVSLLPWDESLALPPELEVLINATSLGEGDADEPLPVSLESLGPTVLVADVVPNPPETWLIRQCRERGCKTIDGLEILLAQAAVDFQRWTGVLPDRTVMREAVEEFLEL